MDKKQIGYQGEQIALDYYFAQGFTLLDRNYTIRGGELDLILSKDDEVVFVEVKVVDGIDDLTGYITKNKLKFVQKSIESYNIDKDIKQDFRLDVVFIKNGEVYQIYENVCGTSI